MKWNYGKHLYLKETKYGKYTFGQVSIPIEIDLDEFSNIKSKPNRLSTNIISRI